MILNSDVQMTKSFHKTLKIYTCGKVDTDSLISDEQGSHFNKQLSQNEALNILLVCYYSLTLDGATELQSSYMSASET